MKRKLLSLLLCMVLLTSVLVPSVSAAALDTYDANTIYHAGDTVIFDGITYTAKWWTQGNTPSSSAAWERTAEYDDNGIAVWYEGMICVGGAQVSYNGNTFTAKWWTTSTPGSDASWELDGGQADDPTDEPDIPDEPQVPGEPADEGVWNAAKIYYQGDVVSFNGISYTAKWWTCGDEPAASAAWEREAEVDESGLPVWYEGMVCIGGAQVVYNDAVYTAKWWTTSEPGSDASWGAIGDQTDDTVIDDPITDPIDDPITDPNAPIQFYNDYTVDDALVSDGDENFKTVGYFPFYSDYLADNIQWDCLTHIVYAFAFPNGQGGLQPLDSVPLIEKMISEGHENGVEVLLGVGGWAYYGNIMEYQFDANTATPELIDSFTDEIVALVEQYGFDGVDMDWEHPRAGTNSWKNYEAMMIQLREKLGSDKLLTAAVLSGVTTSGITYYDAAAQTANVLAVCDWINVMAYDCVCTLDFCQDVAEYWCGARGVPANKVCMGIPFYAYPSNAPYYAMVNNLGDTAVYNDLEGTSNYHNSVPTIQAKTVWAQEYGLGGIMIWELSQDTTDPATSLLRAIHNAVN